MVKYQYKKRKECIAIKIAILIKMPSILEETKYIMQKYNIKANKNLGQNFLVKEEVAEKIVESAKIEKEDLVIEIGPGLGTLTKYLLEKVAKVICIELDSKMIKILNDRFSLYKNFEIINEDVLKVNLQEIIKKEDRRCKIVANLPYYITTPIIMKLLEDKLDIESITVMIQKEVAERLISVPGAEVATGAKVRNKEIGAITYAVYYYCESEKILEVPNYSFIPEPEVTSEVIKLNLRKEDPVQVANKEKMFKIIKNAFTQRRKTLINALVNTNTIKNKEEANKIFEKLGLNLNVRAEELSLQQFADISNLLSK